MRLIRFEVILLILLTFSIYRKLSKKINTSNLLIHTYKCVTEIVNINFSENLIYKREAPVFNYSKRN